HPLAYIGAKPLAGQLAAKPFFPAGFVDQRAGSRELDTDTRIAPVVDDLAITGSSGVPPDEDLTELADSIPADLFLVAQIEQLALLVCDRRLNALEDEEIAATHLHRIR